MMRARLFLILLLLAGCGVTDAPAPDPNRYIYINILSGANQVDLPGAQLSDQIVVQLKTTVNNPGSVRNKEVRFTAPAESGITFTPALAITDSNGIARTSARLGSTVGRYTMQVTWTGSSSVPTTFALETALAPAITQVSPASVAADGTITITGQSFSTTADLNEVQIDGSRARVLSATSTRIDARVPACLPTRSAQVTVRRGALISAGMRLDVTAIPGTMISMARGQAVTVNDPAAISCLRLGAQSATAEYLVVTQQAASTGTAKVPLRLVGLRQSSASATALSTLSNVALGTHTDFADAFEARMRAREAEIVARMQPRTTSPKTDRQFSLVVPEVGDKRSFKVFMPNVPAPTISAVVRAVTKYLVIYEDTAAAGVLSQSDLNLAIANLDDPVYPTDLAVFGDAPDLDRNQRIVVLLTPAVNRLTKVGETSFITGYFDPCDLVGPNDCQDTNQAEILYSFVPDPTGKWGLTHPVSRFVNLLAPLAAHEFAHLLHFNQRFLISGYRTPEELWLQEGLAHFAEDTVAGVLRARGLATQADLMGRENYRRANDFLAATDKTSLIASTGDGSLAERGAAWLFLKYLNFRVGGDFLKRLEVASETGARNVATISGTPWINLLRDWSIALYASGAPELAGVTLPREQTFGAFDLRAALLSVSALGSSLKPVDAGTGDFSMDWSLLPSSISYVRLTAPAGGAVNLTVGGDRGGDFAAATQPQIVIFRIR